MMDGIAKGKAVKINSEPTTFRFALHALCLPQSKEGDFLPVSPTGSISSVQSRLPQSLKKDFLSIINIPETISINSVGGEERRGAKGFFGFLSLFIGLLLAIPTWAKMDKEGVRRPRKLARYL